MTTKIFYATILILFSAIAHAGSLCGDSQCDIRFTFADGGTIVASQGATLKFALGGELTLGEGGEITLGEAGSSAGLEEVELNEGSMLPVLSEILLGAGGMLAFGSGGAVSLVGDIEYPEGSVIDVSGATAVSISAAEDETTVTLVTLAGIDTVGSVSLISAGDITHNQDAEGLGGLMFSGGDTGQVLVINSPAIEFTRAIESAGSLNIKGTLVDLSPIVAVGDLFVEANGTGDVSLPETSLCDELAGVTLTSSSGSNICLKSLEAASITERDAGTLSLSGANTLLVPVITAEDITLSEDDTTETPVSVMLSETDENPDVSVEKESDTSDDAESSPGGGGAFSLFGVLLLLIVRPLAR
ncbi:hypothetical protein ACFL2V_12040 [Pseudomonadota bacterium]